MKIKVIHIRSIYDEDRDLYEITANDMQGRQYLLRGVALPFLRAQTLIAKIARAGEINVELWDCRTPYGTEAWLLDGCEEREMEDERFGYGW